MNFSFANFVLGIIGVALGFLTVRYSYQLNHDIFFLDFVERRFGGGSGTLAYGLIGATIILISLLSIIGIIDLTGSTRPPTDNSTQTQTKESASTSSTQRLRGFAQ